MKDLLRDTLEKEKYIRGIGYNLITIWECQWERRVNSDSSIKDFLRQAFTTLYPSSAAKEEKELLADVRSGKFFGLIECDISTPSELEEKFEEMAPIFKNVSVSREDLGEHMTEFVKEHSHFLKHPQKMLIGSLFGEKILIHSELAKWYLSHGLKITKIYQVIEYIPNPLFKPFADSVSEACRRGDANPDLALYANTCKLVGNSAYGKTITNKTKHRTVKYIHGDREASRKVRRSTFDSLQEIDAGFYEITHRKKKVSVLHYFLYILR